MKCKECGKENNKKAKFCRECGLFLNTGSVNEVEKRELKVQPVHEKNMKHLYLVSTEKLVILSVLTFGFYEIYWYYKQFKALQIEAKWSVSPILRALFYPLTAYSLFSKYNKVSTKDGFYNSIEAGLLAVIIFVLNILWKLPDPFWLITIFTFVPLILVQNSFSEYWKHKYDNELKENKLGGWDYVIVVLGSIVWILFIIGMFLPE